MVAAVALVLTDAQVGLAVLLASTGHNVLVPVCGGTRLVSV